MSLIVKDRFLFPGLVLLLLAGCAAGDGEANADGMAVAEKKAGGHSKKKYPANRLAKESSPYLLLHAHNPVDWYPWGPEAFAKAKKENKPIFLSIGYTSCHWCHVMERLTFMNEKIAKSMNEKFICIKVDREERPDVDDIYMTALQLYFQAVGSRQGGGWPLSMFLTPEGKPFAGGTYFPPETKNGRLGFATVIEKVHDLWTNKRKEIESNAEFLTRRVRQVMKPRPVLTPAKLKRDLVQDATQALLETYDSVYGGLGYRAGARNPSKFPVPAKLALLQYEAEHSGNKDAAKALYYTLDRIAAGGIHDHLRGGFHRYSTDRYWHVPHFEKMLYDQAQLLDVYAKAYQQTQKPAYKEAAEGIAEFVLNDMTDPKGGFYSALDAETEGTEGKYYVWSPEEVEKVLGAKDAKLFKRVYGFHEKNDFEHGYVLHMPKSLEWMAGDTRIPLSELKTRLAAMRKKLLAARNKRTPLLRDDKVLTSWNGLMIRGLANAGRILKRQDYIAAAKRAALFVLTDMRDKQSRLYRTWRGGRAKLNAYVDDYAFLVDGLLALYEATRDRKWLNAAQRLTDDQLDDYWSKTGKGFFFTPHHHEELIARTRNAYDAVIPSGNSISVRNLLRLAEWTGEKKYLRRAEESLSVFAPTISTTPTGMAHMALAVAEYLDGPGGKPRPAKQKPEAKPEAKPESKQKSQGKPQPKSASTPIRDEAIRQVSDESPARKTAKPKPLVGAKAFLSVDRLPVGKTCEVVLLLDIKAGWHIYANNEEPGETIKTTFRLKSKAGVKLVDVKYPKGKKIKIEGIDEPFWVYDKKVAIRGKLWIPARPGAATDEIELLVRYQACDDSRCLPPKTIRLKGKLIFARAGDKVKSINQNLFPKPKR